jgi:hypothetical protein
MKYLVTEEMVMRKFEKDEIPYRCARIEMHVDGESYPVGVGFFHVPHELYHTVRDTIEKFK